ncbi:hypothetical protein [Paraglaciecola sp.]|uniref:hypothetical protein n=1 Tax=Paraglaciecola sp. TaxID=1920173 RepID=UPI003EF33B90
MSLREDLFKAIKENPSLTSKELADQVDEVDLANVSRELGKMKNDLLIKKSAGGVWVTLVEQLGSVEEWEAPEGIPEPCKVELELTKIEERLKPPARLPNELTDLNGIETEIKVLTRFAEMFEESISEQLRCSIGRLEAIVSVNNVT